MEMSLKVNQIKAGSIISYVQILAGIVIGLLYTPWMIRLLGQTEYGLYNTASSIISMLSVLSLGFNGGYIRFFAKYKRANDITKINGLNGIYLLIFSFIGALALACGLFLSCHLDLIFGAGLTVQEYGLARKLMILLTVNLAVSFPMSVFSNIISANERFVFLKLLGLIKTVVGPMVTLPLLLMGFRSVAMVSVTMITAFTVDGIYMYYVFAVLKNRFAFSNFEPRIVKELFVYNSFIAMNLIVDQINWNVDKLLLARYQGTVSVAVYSVGYTLFSYYMMFSTAVSGLFTPKVHRIVCSSRTENIKQQLLSSLFVKVGRIQFLILGLIASGLFFFGHDFIIRIWAGDGYSDSYYVMILLVLSSSVALIQNVGIEIQRAMNLHKFRSFTYMIMALINLVLSVLLCKWYGAIGSAIGTAISMIACNGLVMNIYYAKKCKINILQFWKNIIRMAKGLIIPVAAAVLIRLWGRNDSMIGWGIGVALYTIVYAVSMWFFAMEQYERDLILQPVRTIYCKGRKADDGET